MSRFNLLDEPWISVIVDEKGHNKLVSITDVFKHASEYKALAGDMKTQDFALLRVLLAAIHTVFSRYDIQGNSREFDSGEDSEDDFNEETMDIWREVWNSKKFPDAVFKYLEQWHDHFYLFDDKYPFFQVLKQDIDSKKLGGKSPSEISGKNINRLISESNNKIAVFSPKDNVDNNKSSLTEPQLARWIITLQSYAGLADKTMFGTEKYKASKGWLFDLGGIEIIGANLFETLMLNCVLVGDVQSPEKKQKPCWEYSGTENIENSFYETFIDNISQLYTRWSRAIYINPDISVDKPISVSIVKLPDINHKNSFIEPMTVWQYNKEGENKDKYTPRKHRTEEAMWRSFGLLTSQELYDGSVKNHKPGIMEWLNKIKHDITGSSISLQAISMKDDGNATSWVPTDEICDTLYIDEVVVTDNADDGWVYRINNEVEYTRSAIGFIYKQFLLDICEIRNRNKDDATKYSAKYISQAYFLVDQPFREWLANIKPKDSMNERCTQWRNTLHNILIDEAKGMLENATLRDFTGRPSDQSEKESTKNIVTAYNIFTSRLKKLSGK
ncbi:type I-E CRISPR-associated protein Cse1/CasA [Gardnerella vaginalis]|uniref:Putative CRISPR system CASCADE complex protein CasA n=1 Tax=Gardnerella vaginalis (strain ATCC 14019 / 317) TaxID=525284 RepID=E3D9K9_GARV3|nr:type I-E CRISPR-associated protein Cse1/CasA [Gardnerella vaginalis]ADP38753.1 putative CRISPR system CASCADE complex protein CasA [Gardnerella vaginalis ATCC 14019]KOS09190.1 CRISPR-associated protein CasA [Gardnerella vaginalis]TCH80228.1 type I-E CRISPR-associated protein Cse1/CasA [Gardnerella vaginalis]TCH81809.1 type I-E CRISPR-associated protein Cse1/CasA [Gardnerella vaginalis ATCC 14018 = JCM 11026]SDR66592.1 CRISPR system Cascade subunit CasA [Gardnerella vaginalis]